ncbi:GIY-YIG nuclease family protein [Synechocystis sp. PCC 7509]|uniref:GIY-YIG nuclease family protein n=1 Tax=Synechocystis sp. PCC 7509 TaxID=927677 RepID=UPI000684BEF3|nr:GIY-YIG nuclease family protein [Synechocystis sp. PCC 7509]
MKKEVFFTPRTPSEPTKGMGWIEINDDAVKRLGIHHLYKWMFRGSNVEIVGPDGLKFNAYLDNPNGYGGRHKKRFIVHSHGEVVLLLVQKKLTIDAVLHFVRSWAKPEARVITPGKRVITLSSEYADLPGYVYFVFNLDSNAIKIGFAKDVQKRLAALQTSSPSQLKLLGVIRTQSARTAEQLEGTLHQQFAQLHISGEWFKAEETLLNYLREVN